MREPVQPTLDEHGDEKHPAWGRMTVTRGQGTPVALFDSDIKHAHTVNVALHTAKRKRDLHRDWIHTGKQKFEIQMSESQWAAFVASVGQGSGTSCTIRFDMSQDDPMVPGVLFESRLKQSSDEVRGAAKEAIESVLEAFKKVEEKPNKGNVRELGFAIQNLPSNLAFAADSLTEHMEGVVSKARADIEAMVTTMAAERGLDPGDLGQKLLEGGDELSYPEHDKLLALGEQKDDIQSFLDWLDANNIRLATYGRDNGYGDREREHTLYTLREGNHPFVLKFRGRSVFEQIMAAYFEIDLDKISDEKDQMLADIRAKH